MRFFLTLLIALAFLSPVLGAEIYYYEVVSEIQSTGESFNRVSFVLNPNTTSLSFTIYGKITDFKYEWEYDGNCTTVNNILGTEVSCSGLVNSGESKLLKFSYNTFSYTRIENKSGVFLANYKLSNQVDSVSVAVKLPEGFVLAQDSSLPKFSPNDGVITSDGRRIIIQWFRKDSLANSELSFSTVYEDKRPDPIMDLSRVVVASGVLVIIFGIVMYFVLKTKQKEQTETIFEVLTSEEKKIINIVKDNGGSIIQKKIVETTDYSKAKVSRIIKDLQLRGIISTEPHGRENIVHLTKKIKK